MKNRNLKIKAIEFNIDSDEEADFLKDYNYIWENVPDEKIDELYKELKTT